MLDQKQNNNNQTIDKGVLMFLPESRYQGLFNDDEWIQEKLAKLPQQWRAGSIKKYSTVFQNKGRASANTWLREGVRDFGIK